MRKGIRLVRLPRDGGGGDGGAVIASAATHRKRWGDELVGAMPLHARDVGEGGVAPGDCGSSMDAGRDVERYGRESLVQGMLGGVLVYVVVVLGRERDVLVVARSWLLARRPVGDAGEGGGVGVGLGDAGEGGSEGIRRWGGKMVRSLGWRGRARDRKGDGVEERASRTLGRHVRCGGRGGQGSESADPRKARGRLIGHGTAGGASGLGRFLGTGARAGKAVVSPDVFSVAAYLRGGERVTKGVRRESRSYLHVLAAV